MESSSIMDTTETTTTTRKKPRTCPQCKRHFRRYEHLQRHIRIHTNEKPYKCACGASFARRDLLKRHQDSGHSPITPSTRQPSPAPGHPSSVQPQCVDAQAGNVAGSSSIWDLPEIPGDPADSGQEGQFPGYQPEGDTSLFNTYDPLQDFESFSHSMGLTFDWALPSEPELMQIVAREPGFHVTPTPSTQPRSQEDSTFSQEQSLTQLPVERDSIAEFGVLTLPILRITDEHRGRLLQSLAEFQMTVTSFLLPSSHSLTRFVNAFFDGFYPHMPVVHIPTFKVDECEPEIILAMAALGAQYRHEHRKGVSLFYAAKAVLQETTREKERNAINENLSLRSSSQSAGLSHETRSPTALPHNDLMRETRCALYLIAFATWQREPDIAQEAFNLQSFLARCVRESRLDEDPEILQATMLDWHSWVHHESHRRLKMFSFAILNLQSIAFNVPPVILSDEICLRLPCTCTEWIAPNKEKWARVHNSGHQEQMSFQEALAHLMKGVRETNLPESQPVPSPLANYILLHALIQRTMLVHQVFRSENAQEQALFNTQKDAIRNALRAWILQWQRAPESSLDPRNPNGPIPFTSIALLGLAYVRLAFDIGSYRILQSRDPVQIAHRLLQVPRLPAGPHLLPAILHATHALSIPVKLGVEFVARSHAFVWSIQHSLCGFEFAVFISKWLYCIRDCQTRRPLDDHESRLIGWITDIVEEGRTSSDEDLFPGPVSPSDCAYLAFAAVKLWARLIKGNEQWAILRVIGESLDIYADLYRDRHISQLEDAS